MDARTQQLEQLLRRAHVYIGRVASIGAQQLSGEILAAINSAEQQTRAKGFDDAAEPPAYRAWYTAFCQRGKRPTYFDVWLARARIAARLANQATQPALPPEIPNQLLGQIIDEVFDSAIEDATVILDIYRVIAAHYGVPRP